MLRFLPLAYLAGIHGFALFAPYMAIFFGLGQLLRFILLRRPVPVAVAAPVSHPCDHAHRSY
jgi:hypothetical protein